LLSEAANAAFQNSVDLFEEAKLLADYGKWARSYALALLAAEQYTKSFEFKCEQIGFKLAKVSAKKVHAFRLLRFTFLLILPHLMSVGGFNFFAKLANVPLREPDRKFMKRVYVVFGKQAERKKELAFYVDLSEKLRIPSKEIKKEDCKAVLDLVAQMVGSRPLFLTEKGEHLKSALGMNFFPLFERSQSELFKMFGKQYLKEA
jgi:hypothetical protein